MHRPFDGGDIKFLYAAYKRQAKLNWIPDDLPPAEFRDAVFTRIAEHRAMGGDILTMIGHTSLGEIPLGIMEVNVTVADHIRPQAVPHALWFPEASPRNKIESTVRFLDQLRQSFAVMIVAAEANWMFFNRVCQYGVLRPVGKLRNYHADGSDAMFYQGT